METTNTIFYCPYCFVSFETARKCGCHKRGCKLNPNYEKFISAKRLGGYKTSQTHKLNQTGFYQASTIKSYSVTCNQCGKVFTTSLTEYQYHKKTKFYCSRACANTRRHNTDTCAKISKSLLNFNSLHHPKTQHEPRYCVVCGAILCKQAKLGYCRKCIYKSPEFRRRVSEGSKCSEKTGGYRINSTFGHHGWYKGYYCDSSWELAYVIYNLEHDIAFQRNHDKFKYIYEHKEHTYLPDFIVDDVYIEIKGRWTDKWQAKLDQFPKDKKLVVLTRPDMKPYLDYTISKYGRNFISLYEDKTDKIDYTKPHWYTNTETGIRTVATKKLDAPWVYGCMNIDKLNIKKEH